MPSVTDNKTTVFNQRCTEIVRAVEAATEEYLTACRASLPATLQEAMSYSLQAGGKRLRPLVLVLACQACGKDRSAALPAAAAIEMVHTYSLIHDDLPAMDNDDLRRGKPASHKVFGDAIAILAGDALLTLAFHVLALHTTDSELLRRLVIELAHAAGAMGMISGQVQDMQNEGATGTLEVVHSVHLHKTAMMFRGAARMGAICAAADDRLIDTLGCFGINIGLAFQIIDDILDVTATPEQLGKNTQKDQTAGKLTYPAVLGIEQSRRCAEEFISKATAALEPLGESGGPIKQLIQRIAKRTN